MKQKYYLLLLTILISCIGFANTDKDSLVKSTKTVKAHVSSPHDNVLDSVTKRLLRQINNAPTANKSNTSNIGGQFRSFPPAPQSVSTLRNIRNERLIVKKNKN